MLALEPPPAVEGQGRIAIDAVGYDGDPGPFRVDAQLSSTTIVATTGDSISGGTTRLVCDKTPCVVNLPYGHHELVVGANGKAGHVPVVVGERPTVVNIVVGIWKTGPGHMFQSPSYEQWEPPDGIIYTRGP